MSCNSRLQYLCAKKDPPAYAMSACQVHILSLITVNGTKRICLQVNLQLSSTIVFTELVTLVILPFEPIATTTKK